MQCILHVQHWMLAKTEICWEENGVLKLTPNRGTSEEGRHLYHHHLGVLKVKRTNYNVTMSCKCTTTFVDHFHCSQTVEQGNPKLTCLWQQHIQIRFFYFFYLTLPVPPCHQRQTGMQQKTPTQHVLKTGRSYSRYKSKYVSQSDLWWSSRS